MRFVLFFIFIFVLSCTNSIMGEKRVFICGDHPCVNKKEVEDYFNNNISIEVYTIDSDKKKNENFDLVELNLLKDKLEAKETITASQKKKNINEAIKERKKLAKLKMKKVKDSDQTFDKTKENIKISQNNETIKKKKASKFTFVRICKNLEECDIDKIAKIIMNIGREKDFPNISN